MFPLIVSPTCTGLTEKQKTLVGCKTCHEDNPGILFAVFNSVVCCSRMMSLKQQHGKRNFAFILKQHEFLWYLCIYLCVMF